MRDEARSVSLAAGQPVRVGAEVIKADQLGGYSHPARGDEVSTAHPDLSYWSPGLNGLVNRIAAAARASTTKAVAPWISVDTPWYPWRSTGSGKLK